MAATYNVISTQTLGTATATVTFSSIPQTYTDLVLVTQSRASTSGANDIDIGIGFNGDTSSVYSRTVLSGNGSAAASSSGTGNSVIFAARHPLSTGTANVLGVANWNIMNYAQANTYKTVVVRSSCDGASVNDLRAVVGLWSGTAAAITSLSLILAASGNFAVGSTFTLYGIKAA